VSAAAKRDFDERASFAPAPPPASDPHETERQLRISEERYRSLVVATAQVVWSLDTEGRSAGELPSWCEFTGQTLAESLGFGWLKVIHPDDRELVLERARLASTSLAQYSIDYRMRRSDGEYRRVLNRVVPVFNEDGTVREWIGTCTDVTEQRQAEEERLLLLEKLARRVRELTALQHSARILQSGDRDADQVLREILDVLPPAFLHPERVRARLVVGDLRVCSEGFPEHLDPSLGQPRGDEAPDANLETPLLAVDFTLKSGTTGRIEVAVVTDPDGPSPRPFSTAERRLLESLAEMLSTHFERRAAEDALYLSQFALDHGAASAFLIRSDGGFAYVNSAASDLVGIPIERLVAGTVFDVRPDLTAEQWEGYWWRLKERKRMSLTLDVSGPSGRRIPTEIYVDLVEYRGVQYGSGVALDLSARRLAEEERREALQTVRFLGQIVEDAEDAIISADLEGRISSWNRGAQRMYGYSIDEAVGQPLAILVPDDRMEEANDNLGAVLRGGRIAQFETLRLRRDGSPINVSLSESPVHDAEGSIVGISVIGRDVTSNKQLEEQLRQAQKMEAIGHLAGGIAHDFNNLLTVINGYGDLLASNLPHDSSTAAMAREIRRAGGHAASLTSQLLAFSRRQVLKPVPLDLNVLVRGLEPMLDRLIGETVELATKLDPRLQPVIADPSQIEQVLMNLVVNAVDAMPEGGVIAIETASVVIDDPPTRPTGERLPAGNYAVLRLSDNGCGMDEKTLERIFEPFFTTKATGKGTGLGLATVYGIVVQSGGFISVKSLVGAGTTFSIHLPQVGETVHEVEEAPPDPPETEPRKLTRILLVEDDNQVRKLLVSVLETAGYEVVAATDGEHALELATEYAADAIDLLLTDVVMPRLRGGQLAGLLRADRPGLKVLFLSGYSDEAIEHQGVLGVGCAFIQKPCSPKELTRRVRELLAG
jgi:PAS domain S-box-containing protein